MSTRTPRILLALGLSLLTAAPVLAADGEGSPSTSRHTFRGMSLGTADQLAQRRFDSTDVQIVRGQPLRGETQTIRTTSSTGSAATSDLAATARIATAPMRSAVATIAPVTNTASIVRQATPLVVGAAEDAQAQFDERAAVDNNARLARNYQSYQPATVSYEDAQLALAAGRVQTVAYGNTYGTYSPASYHGAFSYNYAPRTYYRPSSSYGYTSVYYSSAPSYYTSSYYARPVYSSYCAPVYTSYCAPTYYQPAYYRPSYSYYGGYSNCYRPSSFGFSYGRGGHRGSSWGFSIGW